MWKNVCLVIGGDDTKCTWLKFLRNKDDCYKVFCKFIKQVQN